MTDYTELIAKLRAQAQKEQHYSIYDTAADALEKALLERSKAKEKVVQRESWA